MAGLLSDVLPAVYSASNVMKNKLRGLLDDPLGTLQQVVGDANDRARSFNQLGDRSAAETVASVKAGKGLGSGPASNALLGKIADAYNPVAMTVWHGSPHQFNKFDASKIGTGEGAQAYGHGLYLAESPMVAGQYAENVKDMGAIKNINAELSRLSKVMDSDLLFGQYRKFKSNIGQDAAKQYDELLASRDGVRTAPGALYKVDLPDDQIAKMLDWDKPLSQQAQIRAALTPENMGLTLRPPVDGGFMAYVGTNGKPIGVQMKGATPEKFREHWLSRIAEMGDLEGGAGRAVGYLGGTSTSGQLAPVVSGAMRQAGIPGIRYLDGGSRGAGAGSSNFVVFPGNEDMLTILERNGQPVNALRGLLDR